MVLLLTRIGVQLMIASIRSFTHTCITRHRHLLDHPALSPVRSHCACWTPPRSAHATPTLVLMPGLVVYMSCLTGPALAHHPVMLAPEPSKTYARFETACASSPPPWLHPRALLLIALACATPTCACVSLDPHLLRPMPQPDYLMLCRPTAPPLALSHSHTSARSSRRC